MKYTFLFTFTILLSSTNAQSPQRSSGVVSDLTQKIDRYDDSEKIKQELSQFLMNAPNEELKNEAIQEILTHSESDLVKQTVQQQRTTINQNETSTLLLKNVTIIDMVSEGSFSGDVLIKDGIIEEVFHHENSQIPDEGRVINLQGKFLIPGLIDNHVHITHGTLAEAEENLKIALKHGITGVRDMGGDGRMLTLLQKNMAIGETVGSDVFFSTIIAGPDFFKNDPRPQQVAKGAIAGEVPWQRAITHDSDFRQVIAEAKGLGVTAIKWKPRNTAIGLQIGPPQQDFGLKIQIARNGQDR